jgi:hypothetical protein
MLLKKQHLKFLEIRLGIVPGSCLFQREVGEAFSNLKGGHHFDVREMCPSLECIK